MRRIDIAELLSASFDWDKFVEALVSGIEDKVDYDEVASAILDDLEEQISAAALEVATSDADYI